MRFTGFFDFMRTYTIDMMKSFKAGSDRLILRIKNQGGFTPAVVIPFKFTNQLADNGVDTFLFEMRDFTAIEGIDLYEPEYLEHITLGTASDQIDPTILYSYGIKITVNDTMVFPAGGTLQSGGAGEYAYAPISDVSTRIPGSWNGVVIGPDDDLKVDIINLTGAAHTDLAYVIGVLHGYDVNMRNLV